MSTIIDNILEKNGIKKLYPFDAKITSNKDIYAYIKDDKFVFCDTELHELSRQDLQIKDKNIILSLNDEKWSIAKESTECLSYLINEDNAILTTYSKGFVFLGTQFRSCRIPRADIVELPINKKEINYYTINEELRTLRTQFQPEICTLDADLHPEYEKWIELEKDALYFGVAYKDAESDVTENHISKCIVANTVGDMIEIELYPLIIKSANGRYSILDWEYKEEKTEFGESERCIFHRINSEGKATFVSPHCGRFKHCDIPYDYHYSFLKRGYYVPFTSERSIAIYENDSVQFFDLSSIYKYIYIGYSSGFIVIDECDDYYESDNSTPSVICSDGRYGRLIKDTCLAIVCNDERIYNPEPYFIDDNLGAHGVINLETGKYILPCLFQSISVSIDSNKDVISKVGVLYKKDDLELMLYGLFKNSDLICPIANHSIELISYTEVPLYGEELIRNTNYALVKSDNKTIIYYHGEEIVSLSEKVNARIPTVDFPKYSDKEEYEAETIVIENSNHKLGLVVDGNFVGLDFEKIQLSQEDGRYFYRVHRDSYYQGIYEKGAGWLIEPNNHIISRAGKWVVYRDMILNKDIIMDINKSIYGEFDEIEYLDFDNKTRYRAYSYDDGIFFLSTYRKEPKFYDRVYENDIILYDGFRFHPGEKKFIEEDEEEEYEYEKDNYPVDYPDDTDWERESWIALGGDPDLYNGSIDDLMDEKGY